AWEMGANRLDSMTNGPAKLCQALAIDGGWNGHDLCAPASQLFVEKQSPVGSVTTGPRVGLNSTPEPWFSKPWRFMIDRKQYPTLLHQEESE
ncbi:MAG: DNA-3-methyladenine glycosylase, partial [Nitrospiraceae bacterium]